MKQSNTKLPLKVYLSCAFLIFSVILLIIMWLFQTVFLDSFYRSVKTRQVERCAKSVVYNIKREDLTSMLNVIETQNDMNVSVYETTNSVFTPIYTPDRFMSSSSMISITSIYQYYRLALENNGETTIKSRGSRFDFSYKPFGFKPPLDRESSTLLAYATVIDYEDSQFLVVVESEITPVTSTVDTLRYQLIIMTIIIVIISIFISIITAHYVSKPIRDTNTKAKQLAKQNYDLTFKGGNYKELCELNETLTYSARELAKVDTLRRELIANISHDLRTPLTMITGYSEVMRDLPGENTPENMQVIIDEANRLGALVNDLLDISKLESGAIAVENIEFSLTDCIKDILVRYKKLIEQDAYNIVFEYEGNVSIKADPLRISQVMYNLINNAINYCADDNTVIVRQTVINDTVRIEVIDHGVGIKEDQLEYIWDRYYKVDKEHKRAVIGTGLGLSIVKNILNFYNTDYGVISKPNQGSNFWWTFKIANHTDGQA